MATKPVVISEQVRHKICFGEDPLIYTQKRELSKKELEILGNLTRLDQRRLGDYLSREELIPDKVWTYAMKGYGSGNGFCFLGISVLGVEKNLDIDNVTEMFTDDLREIKGDVKGLEVKARLSEDSAFFPDLSVQITPRKGWASFLRAYCANLQEGAKALGKIWRDQNG